MSVLPSEAVKSLEAYADKNKETQGKFTIGDEKVRSSRTPLRSGSWLTNLAETQRLHAATGPRDSEGHGEDGPHRDHDQVEGDEEQLLVSAVSHRGSRV